MQSPPSLIPLSMLTPGDSAQLMIVRSCESVQKRLAELGLNVGICVRVVQSDPSGPMILAFRNDARLAIGHGIAQKIMVSLDIEEVAQ